MSLRVWLPLNGNLENKGISNYTISIARGSEIYNNAGKIGQCFYSNGVNTLNIQNIIPDTYNYTGYSLCAWLYIEANNTTHSGSGVISGGNWNSQLLNLALSDWSSDHYTKLRISGTNWNNTYDYNFYKNIWYHVVVCSDGNKTYGYVNGTLIGNTAAGFLPSNIEGNNIYIGGATYYSGMQFFGRINDVRIYDHCLSAAEVRELAQGLILHYKLDFNNENLLLDIPQIYRPAAYNSYLLDLKENLIANQTYTLQLWDVLIEHDQKTASQLNLSIYWGGGSVQLIKLSGSQYFSTLQDHYAYSPYICIQITPTAENAAGNGATNAWLSLYNSTSNVNGNRNMHIGAWKMEKGSVATAWTSSNMSTIIIEDSSGYNHHGEILNGPLTAATNAPRYNNGTYINATNQKIKIANFPTSGFGNSYTFAWWAKISSVSPMHWGFADGIRLNGMYTGRLWNTADGSNNPLYVPGTTTQVTAPTVNIWHHWVMTGDGTKCRVYQDGELWGEAKTYKAISGTTIYINGWDTSTSYSSNNYSISDFRIYCTQLLDNDVKQLYNTSMKIDNKNNIHIFETIENNNNKINKQGQLICDEINEINFTTNVKNFSDNEWYTHQIIER